MKTLVMLLLVLSTLFVVTACAADTDIDVDQPEEVTEEEAIEDIDSSLVSEEDDVEIGEMI